MRQSSNKISDKTELQIPYLENIWGQWSWILVDQYKNKSCGKKQLALQKFNKLHKTEIKQFMTLLHHFCLLFSVQYKQNQQSGLSAWPNKINNNKWPKIVDTYPYININIFLTP